MRDDRELRVTFGFASAPFGRETTDTEVLKGEIAERMGALRWERARLLKALWAAPDLGPATGESMARAKNAIALDT
ncbi:hypothetical protein ACFYMW_18175 [Streptomyces sp. NPDC006692]|uniref:hypothetical protein n=1 Tax=Streptomyces sp. NPDC006692 TaxID=3364758 RepID=UPI0036C6CC3B